jgi:hypothetical protein
LLCVHAASAQRHRAAHYFSAGLVSCSFFSTVTTLCMTHDTSQDSGPSTPGHGKLRN